MTELTQHDADEGFHEIQLNGKQVVFEFMLTAVLGVAIFLLGVHVGRNAKSPRDEAVDAVGAPESTSAPQTAASPKGSPPAEAPPTASEGDVLSYGNSVKSASPPQEKLAARSDAASPPAGVKPPPKPSAPAERAAPPAPQAAASSAGRPGVWVVQLVALKDRAAAAAVVQRLSAKGYPAFVVSPSAGAPSIYRVQVGRYNDRREAEQIARRLEKEEQFKPWISH